MCPGASPTLHLEETCLQVPGTWGAQERLEDGLLRPSQQAGPLAGRGLPPDGGQALPLPPRPCRLSQQPLSSSRDTSTCWVSRQTARTFPSSLCGLQPEPSCQNPLSLPDFGVNDTSGLLSFMLFSEANRGSGSILSFGQDGKL